MKDRGGAVGSSSLDSDHIILGDAAPSEGVVGRNHIRTNRLPIPTLARLLVLVIQRKVLQLVAQSKELLVSSTRLEDEVTKASGKVEVQLHRHATVNMETSH